MRLRVPTPRPTARRPIGLTRRAPAARRPRRSARPGLAPEPKSCVLANSQIPGRPQRSCGRRIQQAGGRHRWCSRLDRIDIKVASHDIENHPQVRRAGSSSRAPCRFPQPIPAVRSRHRCGEGHHPDGLVGIRADTPSTDRRHHREETPASSLISLAPKERNVAVEAPAVSNDNQFSAAALDITTTGSPASSPTPQPEGSATFLIPLQRSTTSSCCSSETAPLLTPMPDC